VAGAAWGALAGAGDVAWTLIRLGGAPVGTAAMLALHAIALGSAAGLLVGALGSAAAPGLGRLFEDAPPSRAAAALLAALITPLVLCAGVFLSVLWLTRSAHDPTLIAAAAAATAFAALGLGIWAALVVLPALSRLVSAWRPLGRPGLVAWLSVPAVAGGLATLLLVRPALSHHPALPALVLSAFAAAGWLISMSFAHRRRLFRAALLVAFCVAGLVFASAIHFPRHAPAAFLASREASLTSWLRQVAALPFDADRDGHARAWGGGDCDDSDPTIHPGAWDQPGDGVDSNCWGGDARADAGHLRVAAPGPPPGPPATGLFLLTFDAVRRDVVGAYGYERRPTTPNLDRLAARALRFDHVYAASSRSLRSIPSLLAGLYPSQIGWGEERLFQAVLPGTRTLATHLASLGWRTAAFSNTDYFVQSPGFYAGFGHTGLGRRFMDSATATVRDATRWLEALPPDARFFLWVHLFDAHAPYQGHGETTAFGGGERARYDQEVAWVDRLGGQLLDALAASPHSTRTAVLVSADHGEAFGEHGRRTHGQDLYDEVLLVPLLLAAPGVEPGVVAEPASLVDVAPTLLHLAGVPPLPGAGRSLLGPLDLERPLFAELLPDGEFPNDMKAVLLGPHKLVLDVRSGQVALYDRQADPGERHNLVNERPATAGALEATLRSWMETATLGSNRRQSLVEQAVRADGPPPATPTPGVTFGDSVALLGYDLPQRAVPLGSHLPVSLTFSCLRPMKSDLVVRLRFHPGNGLPRLFHGDHTPVAGSFPTSEWREGQVVRDVLKINVFDIVPPGSRHLRLSLADATGPLPVRRPDGTTATWVDLGEVVVLPR